jgi:predicted kinase
MPELSAAHETGLPRPLAALVPRPPGWTVPWERIEATLGVVRALRGVRQDPSHHAEGDVDVHTRMACEALTADPNWRARPPQARARVFVAVLLHDVGKPATTRPGPDGRLQSRGHSRAGELLARRTLWELGTPIPTREAICALVRHHQVPFWAMERPDAEAIAYRVSLLASNAELAQLAVADATGRICADADPTGAHVQLYRDFCAELGCLDTPRTFPSDHARYWWFRHPGRDPDYAAYDDTRLEVTVMSGLPGAGKDHWIARHRADRPVVSLDAVRAELRVDPADDQAPVVAAARERARDHLRAGRAFVWNATNVSRDLRRRVVDLAADYDARVEIVAVEAPPVVVTARNTARTSPVPRTVLDRLVARWEPPDPTEAHRVVLLDTSGTE